MRVSDSFAKFSTDGKVRLAFSTRGDGSMKKENQEIDHANLLRFYKKSTFSGMPICMQQVHSATVNVVESNRELVIGQCDGLLTNKKNLALSIMTADCLPILLFDPENRVIGALHAGRRGILKGIIAVGIEKMKDVYKTNPSDLRVVLGPAVRSNCYEVGADVYAEFSQVVADSPGCARHANGKYFLSLKKAALTQLVRAGVQKEQIELSTICTKCDTNYYSYRRGDNGRFVTLISLT